MQLSRVLFETPVLRKWLEDDSDMTVNIHLDEVYFGSEPHLELCTDGSMVKATLVEDCETKERRWHFLEY